jgi:hypothetical protein
MSDDISPGLPSSKAAEWKPGSLRLENALNFYDNGKRTWIFAALPFSTFIRWLSKTVARGLALHLIAMILVNQAKKAFRKLVTVQIIDVAFLAARN